MTGHDEGRDTLEQPELSREELPGPDAEPSNEMLELIQSLRELRERNGVQEVLPDITTLEE